jgi:hypothetical protein
MKHASPAVPQLLLSVSLAAFNIPLLHAKPHCPGNVASLPFHLVLSQIVVPVTVNHMGPYDFVVDTGTQSTMIDPSLAAELHLKTQGTVEVVGVGFSRSASFARIDLIETGSQAIANHVAEVLEQRLLAAGVHIRGILGGYFLEHFDVLIDYAHSLLCLDGMKTMRTSVKGVRVELATPVPEADEIPSAGLVLIPVHLSGTGPRLLLLAIDSGANAPLLYHPSEYLDRAWFMGACIEGHGGDGVRRVFSLLRPQNMQIGSLNLPQISFVAPADVQQSWTASQVDGLLPTSLFRSVFVSYADHFAVLDPH